MAGCKLITYDLLKAGQNYDGLIQKIKDLGMWAKVCESAWVVKTSLTSLQVASTLLGQIDSNDRLFVTSLTVDSAWRNVICGDKWLKDNL
jgi:hypothetical protein